ncbi:MAG: GNAT family N-acetyltransferase [Bacteroidetes bacterium]|nr:MAG: GNAT family N-acetyltransferase [Bacteroidota bacterium]
MTIKYRPIKEEEYPFLEEMLYEALFVPKGQPKFPKSIIQHPNIIKYVKAWNQQKGDLAIVAVNEQNLVGVIWGRKFQVDKKGYGFVDENTPEISIAIKDEYRNKGIGTGLLTQIEIEYSRMGVENVSLSVDKRNPARKLYERCGYELYNEQETAVTMIKKVK